MRPGRAWPREFLLPRGSPPSSRTGRFPRVRPLRLLRPHPARNGSSGRRTSCRPRLRSRSPGNRAQVSCPSSGLWGRDLRWPVREERRPPPCARGDPRCRSSSPAARPPPGSPGHRWSGFPPDCRTKRAGAPSRRCRSRARPPPSPPPRRRPSRCYSPRACVPGSRGFGPGRTRCSPPVPPRANSCRFVFPTITAPASMSLRTQSAVSLAAAFPRIRLPAVVGWPSRSNRSLSAMGIPWSGPRYFPARVRNRAAPPVPRRVRRWSL